LSFQGTGEPLPTIDTNPSVFFEEGKKRLNFGFRDG